MVDAYDVEFFTSTLLDFVYTPSGVDPPTRDDPASMKITFDTSVQIADGSPTTPTANELDMDIERAFENGTTFFDYLTQVVTDFQGTPFGSVFGADWVVIEDTNGVRRLQITIKDEN
jgi:hypothetical protein